MPRRRSWTILVAALLVVAGPPQSAAVAKTPAGSLPDAGALRAQGVRVSWPLRTATASLAPGTVLRVHVKPVVSRKRRTVRLAFVRTTATGRPLRTLFSQRLRRGTFTAVVPGPVGATHHLTLTVGRRVYRSIITTAAPPASAGPSAASDYVAPVPPPTSGPYLDPGPGIPVIPPCSSSGTASALLRVSVSQVAPGGTVGYEATNASQRCLVPKLSTRVERRDGDAWVPVGMSSYVPGGQSLLLPGDLYSGTVTLRPDADPGRHRLTLVFDVTLSYPDTVEASAEFDVVAP